MPKQNLKRNLIKFSHYSTSLVLPKKMLDKLGWQAGDAVVVNLDAAKGRLLITKAETAAATEKPLVMSQAVPQSRVTSDALPRQIVPETAATELKELTQPPVVVRQPPLLTATDTALDDTLPIPEL